MKNKTIAIIGLGLMGASLGLAIRKGRLPYTVNGFARRSQVRKAALQRGVVDQVFSDPGEAVRDADIVVVCLPVLLINKFIQKIRKDLKKGSIVTDVGSTKVEICKEAAKTLKGTGAIFIGSHPIAGSDETGIESATAGLYSGAVVVVTAKSGSREGAQMARLWQCLGARVVTMTAQQHDQVIASTSHLPHMVATILVDTVLGSNDHLISMMCGTGFSDSTRIAGGSEDIWHDIVKSNSKNIIKSLKKFAGKLTAVIRLIEQHKHGQLKKQLAAIRAKRISWKELSDAGKA